MGLDTVELVLRVEEEFDIIIPEEVAEKIVTVGDFCEAVIKIRQQKFGSSAPENTDKDVFKKIKEIIIDQLGIEPEQVTREARIVDDLGAD